MARIEKTVFISYRRLDVYTALAVYENLKNQGYDVFFDYRSISSGDFEQIITSNIKARAHFLLILTPTALDRCSEPGDWLRREIEIAIDEKRNIVPLFFKGFRFGAPSVSEKLTGKLKNLSHYNGLNVHEDYFDEAMQRVRTQFLNVPLDTVLHPVSTEVRKIVREEQVAADKALEQIEDVKELVKQAEEKPNKLKVEPVPESVIPPKKQQKEEEQIVEKPTRKKQSHPKPTEEPQVGKREAVNYTPVRSISFRLFAGLVSGLSLIILFVWGGVNIWNNLPTPEPTLTLQLSATQDSQPVATQTFQPIKTNTPSTTKIFVLPIPTLGIGSTMIGKDGATLVYVPEGEFTMGNDSYSDEQPVHKVRLDAFWIDQTEVTNKLFSTFINATGYQTNAEIASLSYAWDGSKYVTTNRDWQHPTGPNSDILGKEEHPAIHISWNDAVAYCEWAGRRLPTEAEWEKSAHGADERIYPWGNESPSSSLLNYNQEVGGTTEVGNYPDGKSIYGAYDMAGNVWEWVSDWYQSDYYATLGVNISNPRGPSNGNNRVLRGGSWYVSAKNVRSANRDSAYPSYSSYYGVGFRCASSP